MAFLTSYRISEKGSKALYHRAQLVGLVPTGLGLLLIVSAPGAAGPGLWAALGVAAGLELVLWGCHALHAASEEASALGQRLIRSSDRWYPATLFILHHLFLILLLVMLWTALTGLGLPTSPLLHGVFAALVLLLPLRGLLHEPAVSATPRGRELACNFTHYLLIALSTLFVALILTGFMLPPGEPLLREVPPPVIVVWVPAILVMLLCLLLFLQEIVRPRSTVKPPRRPEEPTRF